MQLIVKDREAEELSNLQNENTGKSDPELLKSIDNSTKVAKEIKLKVEEIESRLNQTSINGSQVIQVKDNPSSGHLQGESTAIGSNQDMNEGSKVTPMNMTSINFFTQNSNQKMEPYHFRSQTSTQQDPFLTRD